MSAMVELLAFTDTCVAQVAAASLQVERERQQLLHVLSESGIIQHLAAAISTMTGVITAAASSASIVLPLALKPVIDLCAALLQTWVCLTQACLGTSMCTTTLQPALLPAIRLAGKLPALMQQLRLKTSGTSTRSSSSSSMQHNDLHQSYADVAEALPAVAEAAMLMGELLLSNQHNAEYAAAARQILSADETLMLILVDLALKARSCQATLQQISQPDQQQQQQTIKGTPAHQQLLIALDAAWLQNHVQVIDRLDVFLRDCNALQSLLHRILSRRCSIHVKVGSSNSEAAKAVAPAHLQLPLLKVLIELTHLMFQLRVKQQLRPCHARDLFGTLVLMNSLVELICSSSDSSSSSSSSSTSSNSNNQADCCVVERRWPVLPAVVAAGLLRPVMQQLSKLVLSTLNSSKSSGTMASSSSSSTQQTAAAAAGRPVDPSTEDDRRGVTYYYGCLLISLCLSVEPKHLAAALAPDVLTPITLLEATLRAQATHIAPVTTQQRRWWTTAGSSSTSTTSSSSNSILCPTVTALDLQPVALKVLCSLDAASKSVEGFNTAVSEATTAAVYEGQQVVEPEAVLLLKLFTVSITCLKIGRAAAAAAAGEAGQVGPAGAAAAETAAAAVAVGNNMVDKLIGGNPGATVTGSPVFNRIGKEPNPTVVVLYAALVARGLHVYLQHWLQLPQQQQKPVADGHVPVAPINAGNAAHHCVDPAGAAAAALTAAGPLHCDKEPVTDRLSGLQALSDICTAGISALDFFATLCFFDYEDLFLERYVDQSLHPTTFFAVHDLGELQQTAERLRSAAEDLHEAAHANVDKDVIDPSDAPTAVDMSAEDVEQLHQQAVSLARQLDDVALHVCASIPPAVCCNNPECVVLAKLGESQLVGGKGCICGGCGLARYCCAECQKEHWRRHKAVCRVVKQQQSAAKQSTAAVR